MRPSCVALCRILEEINQAMQRNVQTAGTAYAGSVGRPMEVVPDRTEYAFIDSRQLALKWNVPESWVRDHVRSRAEDPIPHVRLGKYVRFRWASPELDSWAERRIVGDNNR